MTLIASIRSNSYQQILSISEDIKAFNKRLLRLSKSDFPITQIQSSWASSIVSSVSRLMVQIERFRLSEDVVVSYLKRIALDLNRVYWRCCQYLPELGEIAQKLFEQVVALLPAGMALQLELFGQGDYCKGMPEPPTLSCVRDWLSKIGDLVVGFCKDSRPFLHGKQLMLVLCSSMASPL